MDQHEEIVNKEMRGTDVVYSDITIADETSKMNVRNTMTTDLQDK